MLGNGLKTMMLAAGLLLSGVAAAQPAAQPAAGAHAPQGVSNPPGAAATAPTTAAATAPAAPASPLLAQDGAPPMSPVTAVGQPEDGAVWLQPQVTPNGERARHMHDVYLFPLITVVSLFVLGLLAWVVLRYRQAANPTPSRTSHNTAIEVIWTLAPVIILVIIAVPSIGLLQAQFKPAPKGAITLKAIGHQWYWSYQYPDNGGFEVTANMLKEPSEVAKGERGRTDADGPQLLAADNRVVLPVGVPIRLITTSDDVIHSWGMPAFWAKLDAIPGRLNESSFTIERAGLYFGQCSELCGERHAYMPIVVEAVPPAQFAAWVRAKGGTMPAPGQASGAVIPQPGAADSAGAQSAAVAASNSAAPATAGTVSNTISQGATGNPAGAGNAGH